jgi:peptidoglycan/LPS O-acetylase OafA/YrhL
LIQRIQSIYLSLAGIIGFIVGYLTDFIPNELTDMLLLFLIGLFAFISLFCFKNRNVQRKINYLNIIINVLLIGFMVYDLLNSSGGKNLLPEKGVELLVPVLLIILLAMANKYINKDEKLIKSVDRFR